MESTAAERRTEMAYGSERSGREDKKVTCELLENLVVFGQRKDSGWTKEANIVCWNGGSPKLDIREWDPDHERMSKGVTLYEAEAEKLARVLCRRYGISPDARKGKKSGGYESYSDEGEAFEDENFAAAGSDDEAGVFAGEECSASEDAMTAEAEKGGPS
jgi:hypothetical protein